MSAVAGIAADLSSSSTHLLGRRSRLPDGMYLARYGRAPRRSKGHQTGARVPYEHSCLRTKHLANTRGANKNDDNWRPFFHRTILSHERNLPTSGLLKPGFHSNAIACVACVSKRKPQVTQALALASSQSWLPLLRPSIPIGWRLRFLRENQAIAFEWKPGFTHL